MTMIRIKGASDGALRIASELYAADRCGSASVRYLVPSEDLRNRASNRPVAETSLITGHVPVSHPDKAARKAGKQMFLAVAIILAIIWLILFFALHLTSLFIHILIVLAVISLVVHLFTGRKAA